jgi:predicted ATPase
VLISRLDLRDFRRFERVTVELSSLSVITGVNGVGKSMLIDAVPFRVSRWRSSGRP